MRQRAARTGAALEETVGDGAHLVFIAGLLIRNLDLCLPQEQAMMSLHLATTQTWLRRQGFDV